LFRVAAGGVGGVLERPVVTVELAGEDRAGLVGVAADGDHGFHLLGEELVEVLGSVRGDVDADFPPNHGVRGRVVLPLENAKEQKAGRFRQWSVR